MVTCTYIVTIYTATVRTLSATLYFSFRPFLQGTQHLLRVPIKKKIVTIIGILSKKIVISSYG